MLFQSISTNHQKTWGAILSYAPFESPFKYSHKQNKTARFFTNGCVLWLNSQCKVHSILTLKQFYANSSKNNNIFHDKFLIKLFSHEIQYNVTHTDGIY